MPWLQWQQGLLVRRRTRESKGGAEVKDPGECVLPPSFPLHSLCRTVLAQPKGLLPRVSISTFAPQRRSWE